MHNPTQPDAPDFLLRVERFYAALMRAAVASANGEPGLGGELLYVAELDEESRAFVVAGNVAGAAALAATADLAAQKQAIRDGVVDFLVTSLDEGLRILKNEIRKRERVAVCVGLAPGIVEREMAERGVQPDLFRRDISAGDRAMPRVTWSVDSAPAHWLPKLDAIALACLDATQQIERRWLRLAPRHLGRKAQGVRMLVAGRDFASRFVDQVRSQVESCDIGVAVHIQQIENGRSEEHRFTPAC